jgi:hypothetical protein
MTDRNFSDIEKGSTNSFGEGKRKRMKICLKSKNRFPLMAQPGMWDTPLKKDDTISLCTRKVRRASEN